MKKIFLIILIIGLSGCGDTSSQDTTFLHCQYHKLINYDKLARVTEENVFESRLDRKLKLDLINQELYEFNKRSDKYIKIPNVIWKDGHISYVWNVIGNIFEIGELDTVNYTFKMTSNPGTFKSNVVDTFYNCRKL